MLIWYLLHLPIILGYYLGIDFSDPIKVRSIQVSAVQPTRKLSIPDSSALNFEFQDIVAFKSSRLFSEQAEKFTLTRPYSGVQDSLIQFGSSVESIIKSSDEFSLNNLTQTQFGLKYSVRVDGGIFEFTPEELQAMQLEHIKATVLQNLTFKGSVFAIPGFLTQSQKKTLKKLAEVSRLKPQSFIPQTSAIALLTALKRFDETETFGVVYSMKKYFLEVSLFKFATTLINSGKVSERKVETVQLVDSKWNLNFGLYDIEKFLAGILKNEIQGRCGKVVDSKEEMAALMSKVRKILKKFEVESKVKVKLDVVDGCQEIIELGKGAVEEFLNTNLNEIVKPIEQLLQSVENVGFFVPSYVNDHFLDGILSSRFKKPEKCEWESGVSLGSALLSSNFSADIQIRPVLFNQTLNVNARIEISKPGSQTVKIKEIFYKNSLFGTSKKVAFYDNENLIITLQLDYGQGYVSVDQYNLTDITYLFDKFDQKPYIVIEFSIDDFGLVELSNVEARFEFEYEVEEVKPKSKEKGKKKNKGQENKVDPVESTEETEGNKTEKGEDPEPANGTNETSTANDSSNTETGPEIIKTIKKHLLKLPISLTYSQLESAIASNFEVSLSRLLEKLNTHDQTLSSLESARSSLQSLANSISLLNSTSNITSYLSGEDNQRLSNYLSQAFSYESSPAKSLTPYNTLYNSLDSLITQAKTRQYELTQQEYTIKSAQNQLLVYKQDLDSLKPRVPETVYSTILKLIEQTSQWLQENSSPSPSFMDPIINSRSVAGRLYLISTKLQALQQSHQKPSEL